MRLSRLRIVTLPGISDGFTLEGLGEGVHVVTGPNASGKSSLVRALRHLIDEAPDPDGGALTLEAEFVAKDGVWTVTRSGSHVAWRKDGRPEDRPPLPRGNFLHGYWLAMDDLLAAGGTEEEIGRLLRNALQGGYDLEGVRESVLPTIRPRHGRAEEKAFREAERELMGVTRAYEALDDERGRLDELKEAIARATGDAARRARVERSLECLEARRARLAAQARLEGFPEGMERLDGKEASRLDELDARRRKIEEEHRAAEDSIAEAQSLKDATGLAGGPPSAEELETQRQRLDEARQARSRIEHVRAELEEARAAEAEALGTLRPVGDGTLSIAPDTVDRAVRVAEELSLTRRRLQDLEGRENTPPPEEGLVPQTETLIGELRRWLRSGGSDPVRPLRGAAVAGLVLALIGAIAAWRADAGWAVVPMAGAAAAMGWLLWRTLNARDGRSEIRRRAAESPLAQPEAWTPEAVARRLQELETELAGLRVQEAKARENAIRKQEVRRFKSECAQIEERVADLAREVGFDPMVTAEGTARFLNLAHALDQARIRRAQEERKLHQAEKDLNRACRGVADVLARFGAWAEEDPADVAALASRLQGLDRRARDDEAARNSIAEGERARNRLATEREEVENQIAAVYRACGLEAGDRKGVDERCAAFDEYSQARRDRDEADLLERERRTGIGDDPELVALVEGEDEAGLRGLMDDLRQSADRAEGLRDERAALQNRLDQAGRDGALERARMACDRALDSLRDAFDEALTEAAGSFLLDGVAEEHQAEHEPAILTEARERFRRYTHHRFDLEVGSDGDIRARDTGQNLVHAPETLSTGTRMQLLMALRLAWTGVHEQSGLALPIFLDEALTTADPERFRSIALSVKDAAERDGRQIFYLSALPADVVRWEEAVGARPRHIDLAQVRFGEAGPRPDTYAVDRPTPVPKPGGHTPEAYAERLGVPSIHGFADAGEIHLFHLLRDELTLLHALMEGWRVCTLGQAETLLESEAADHAVPEPALRDRILGRCRIARCWTEVWAEGRGRPVDRNALEASGAVSGTFIDEVSQRAEDVGGEARALMRILEDGEVSRFQRKKAEELAVWLEEQGYLAQTEPRDRDGREREVLHRMAGVLDAGEIRRLVQDLEAARCSHGTLLP